MQLYYFISILIFFSLFLFHCSLFIIHYLFFIIHCIGKILSMISNQNGVKNKSTTKEEVQRKVDSIILATGVPMDFICALDDDIFKKPRTGKKDICSYILNLLLYCFTFVSSKLNFNFFSISKRNQGDVRKRKFDEKIEIVTLSSCQKKIVYFSLDLF